MHNRPKRTLGVRLLNGCFAQISDRLCIGFDSLHIEFSRVVDLLKKANRDRLAFLLSGRHQVRAR